MLRTLKNKAFSIIELLVVIVIIIVIVAIISNIQINNKHTTINPYFNDGDLIEDKYYQFKGAW